MDDRKICDYFLIAGLPHHAKRIKQKNEQQHLDYSQQSPQRKKTNSNELAPITDITIIISTLEEEVPEDYYCIEKTPTGFPADLNHGSIKCPSIYLCYRRGTDKPPLTDIGVFYESKDNLMNDSNVVETSYYGNCGNINNGNSKIYLTYRRSKPDAPCNQLVVTDICVILTNKGETPPHAFNLIQKNLNKGLIGSDVFICYKKSMNSPPLLRYTPSIIDRYPQDDLECYKLPESVAMFCLPLGSTIECWSKENSKVLPLLSNFILTLDSGSIVYGVALTFYENFPLDELDTLTNAELKKLGYFSGFEQINKKLVVNKSICLLSRWPFFDLFEGFLNYLYKSVFRSIKNPLSLPVEVYISHFMMNIPFPSLQRPKIRIQLSQLEEDQLTLSNPFGETPLPLSGASFINFLTLGPENCINVFLFALTEQKMLLHSLRLDVLTSVAEALTSLIFPFEWQCPYIPMCPLALCDVLNAPLPFIVGVDSRYFDNQLPPSDLICIDLDTRSIYMSETKRYLNAYKLVPKKAYKNLKKTLEIIDLKMNNTMIEMKKERPSISFSQLSKKLESQFGIEIQEAFLQFMTFIFKDFRKYLKPIKKKKVGSTDPSSLFDFQNFIMSRDKSHHQFYTFLTNTQMFTKFIEERTFSSDKYTYLAFFDECLNRIESTENADFSTFQLIELDDRDKNDRTVFISDPESLVNLADYKKQTYKYSKFGPFNHELFLKEPILSHFDNCRKPSIESRSFESICGNYTNNQSTSNLNLQQNLTSSPMMMKRTKHEVRSAQRVAKRLAETPLTWAKCLISYSYSIWFVHLHSYIRANQQLTLKAKLEIAFNILLRMQSLALHPLDEVCYRILMNLAGIYSHPVLAVKILHEMKKNNVTANAITYGYYSKAVLEGDWKTECDDITDENLHWKRLRNLVDCVAELKRSGKRFANRRLKEGNNLLDYELNHNINNNLSTLPSLDKHDSLFSRQHGKSGSFREKKLNKNRLLFKEEITQKSSIVKGSSINQFNNLVNHSSEAGILMNSQIYQSHSDKRKKVFDRKRHKSEEHSNQNLFNLAKIKEELMNISLNSSDVVIHKRNLPRSKSLSVYKHKITSTHLNNELSNHKTIPDQHIRTPSTNSSQFEQQEENNLINLNHSSSDLIKDSIKDNGRTSEDEHIKNLQSIESLNNENSTFSPLKDAIKTMNPFFAENKVASTLRSSFRMVSKSLSKNQFANSSLFRKSLNKQLSTEPVSNEDDKNLEDKKNSLPENRCSSTESLEETKKTVDKIKDSNETKCNITRSSTLPLSISSTVSNESETSKQSNLSIENESILAQSANETMTKSHSSSDFNSIWSTKFSTNKMDYLNSFANYTFNRLNEFKSTLSASSNHGSPNKPGQPQINQTNNNALFTSLGQNTSTFLTSFASKIAEKIPTNVGPLSEYYEYYMYNTSDCPDGSSQTGDNIGNKQSESSKSDEFFETLEQHYKLNNKDLETAEITILNIEITSCTKCHNCSAILYDEEIMGEWSPDDSNLNTTCRYCGKLFVPKLTINVKYNSNLNSKDVDLINFETENNSKDEHNSNKSDSFEDFKKFSLAYLSPIVLRKELENVVNNEGDFCLINPQFTLEHDIIYWNLVWYFKRTNLPTHLPGIYLMQFFKEKFGDNQLENYSNFDFKNVNVTCLWDNIDLYTDRPKPLYLFWRESYRENNEEISRLVSALVEEKAKVITDNRLIFQILLDQIFKDDLISAIRMFIHKRKTSKTNAKYFYSIYRDLLYLLFAAVDRKSIDHVAFDRVYRHAYDSLTYEETELMRVTDKPPKLKATFCRRTFMDLILKVNS